MAGLPSELFTKCKHGHFDAHMEGWLASDRPRDWTRCPGGKLYRIDLNDAKFLFDAFGLERQEAENLLRATIVEVDDGAV